MNTVVFLVKHGFSKVVEFIAEQALSRGFLWIAALSTLVFLRLLYDIYATLTKLTSGKLVIYTISNICYSLMFSPLRSYPGPKLWAISSIPSAISIICGQSHKTMLALHNKHGPVVRIGPNELSFNSPGSFRDIYMPRSGRPPFGKHPRIYACKLNGVRDSIIGKLDNDIHGKQRRLLAHAFSDRYLREQEGLIVSFVDLLISQLRKRTGEDHRSKEDISGWMNFTTFDIMGDLMFAEAFDCLNDGKLHPWISLIFTSVKGITLVAVMNQFSLIWRISELILPEYLREQMLRAINVTAEKADRRLKKGTTRPDFMSALLKHGLTEEKIHLMKDHPATIMTRAEIHSNSMLITMAGSETTASLLSGCIYYLCKNPIAMADLCSELRSLLSADITSAQCAQLNYLNAVIEESFRLYPPVATVLLRVVPEGGDTVDGYMVPEKVSNDITTMALPIFKTGEQLLKLYRRQPYPLTITHLITLQPTLHSPSNSFQNAG
ncbi:sterigmatocystin biosynthesis P450 monooxygenase stcL [Penicillium lividum]|nr:sterigmatocystin biosynthesis P450 monooxygenase stcL [Penicillium lividum]